MNTPNALEFFAQLRQIDAFRAEALKEGHPALARLMVQANGAHGQSKIIANFLLSLYNSERFKLGLVELRSLDLEQFQDCLRVLAMDWSPLQEVHIHFKNGGEVFEKLAEDWRIKDYSKETTR
ncbi:hypothetical protein HA052_23160 [Chromobacterium haemolyticum]|uniref:DUF7673 domain-containing protein n=1 Tax=Chromobacterium fluminis TaxID=3044269 RepID=A0ABX0L8D7_9NEIS|nr:hypothetical protein [Chromobacterium haemolyticum]NHR08094.1 hypothetical protein [Chromobacterium haemolyticum]